MRFLFSLVSLASGALLAAASSAPTTEDKDVPHLVLQDDNTSGAPKMDAFEAEILQNLKLGESFDLEDEQHGEVNEEGRSGTCYRYRHASGVFL
ncbi:hypothetical protein JCM6882_006328 [Rhodosporidiobolus microsporus]